MIIRWICEKCSKKWIYPIEKCVYCKGSITKQKGSKLKVIGMTKVFIPSPMHPIIPYNIILLEDEFGNRLPKKTMKDYKIGDSYIAQRAKTYDAVSIVKIKYDIYEAITESIGLLQELKLNPRDKILIKPSIIAAAYPYQAVNTNHDFLDALLRILFEHGIKKENIIMAEQALINSDAADAASKAGILEVCKKYDIKFIDIAKEPKVHFEKIEADGYAFNIFKEALSRKIINCPIMKTNFQLGISGAVENLSRLVDESTQRNMYFDDARTKFGTAYGGIEKTLPKLAKALAGITDIITIADAVNGMQAQGPLTLGEPAFLNLILASRNAALLDKIFCEIAMLPVPSYVENFEKFTFGVNFSTYEVVGNELDALKYPIKASIPNSTAHPDIKIIDGKACPACLNLMHHLTSRLVGLRGDELNLVMGSVLNEELLNMLKEKERLVALGDCAIKRLKNLNIEPIAEINEGIDEVEQIVLLKKLLMTKGKPKITPIDKVKSKMKRLLSKVMA